MKTVIIRVEGDGPDLHYMFGEDSKEPERGVLRGGGEHRNFVMPPNSLLTIGTADIMASLNVSVTTPLSVDENDDDAEANEEVEEQDGDGTFEDVDPLRHTA